MRVFAMKRVCRNGRSKFCWILIYDLLRQNAHSRTHLQNVFVEKSAISNYLSAFPIQKKKKKIPNTNVRGLNSYFVTRKDNHSDCYYLQWRIMRKISSNMALFGFFFLLIKQNERK